MRRASTAIAAVLGAACLALFPSARATGVVGDPLVIYDSGGIGQGVVATFAVRPSIFDPLLQAGMFYASSNTTSQGGGYSYSLASQAFPGTFVVGALGCGGLPLWVQGTYPPTEGCPKSRETTMYKPAPVDFAGDDTPGEAGDAAANALLQQTKFEIGHMRARTDLRFSDGLVESVQYGLLGQDGVPIITVKDFDLHTASKATDTLVNQETTVIAKDVELLGGGIRIDLMRSRARTSSNGEAATADATLTLSGVTALVDGKQRRAEIDGRGVHVTDPALSREQRLGADEEIREAFLRAGVRLSAGSPSEITEGSHGEASVGGLSIAVSGAVPGVAVPSELTPALATVLENIPTRCLSEFGAPLPLCFGAGIAPGPGSEFPLTLAIGSATSFSGASAGPVFDTGTPSTGGFTPGGPGQISVTPGAPFQPPASAGDGSTSAAPQQPFVQRGPLTGLVAKMPAAALLWAGLGLVVIAVGIGLGPSLRHAGSD